MLHFNLLASHHSQAQLTSENSSLEELPAIPLSSAEAYEWALHNLNQDYQTNESEKAEPLNQSFNQLDALDFTFTKSYPINQSQEPQQELAPHDAPSHAENTCSNPTLNELTSTVAPNNSLANTNQAYLVQDTLTSSYPNDVLSLNPSSTNSATPSPIKHPKTRRYSYEPEQHHAFSFIHGHSQGQGHHHMNIAKLFSIHKHRPVKAKA